MPRSPAAPSTSPPPRSPADAATVDLRRRAGAFAPAAIALVTALLVVAGTGGDPLVVVPTLLARGWPAALWLVAAAGFGRLAGRGLLGPAPAGRRARGDRAAIDIALGAAVLLGLDGLVFRLSATPLTAWILVGAGLAAAAVTFGPAVVGPGPGQRPAGPGTTRSLAAHGLRGAAGVAAGVLLAAALAAPGLLWRSEFGGYDALSYHLPLPAAWLAAGRSAPIETVAYGWLPNAVEHAFLHLGLLRGGLRDAGESAQLLHAAFAVAAAITTGRVVAAAGRRAGSRRSAAVGGHLAAALVLATPWTVVTGSLAYDEMAVLWMLSASMLLAVRRTAGARAAGRGAAHGAVLAAAVAAKLTAAPLALVPAAAWWWIVRPRGADARPARLAALVAGGLLAGAALLLPWAAANARATGNPVFPFATDWFGAGPWSAEQVDAWTRGHRGGGDVVDVWTAWLGHGLDGAAPAQWSLLPVAGLVAAGWLVAGRRARRVGAAVTAMLVLQVGLWGVLTHAQSRFLLPTAVPLAVAAGVAAAALGRRRPRAATGAGAVLVLGQLAGLAVVVAGERPMSVRSLGLGVAIGRTDLLRGDLHEAAIEAARRRGARAEIEDLRRTAPASWWINHALPPSARVLLIGEAAVWAFDPARIAWRTVWDRDALSAWLDAEDAAAAGTGPDAPAWPVAARRAGFTHVLVNEVMLENWSDPSRRWNDPHMTWAKLSRRAGGGLEPIAWPAPGVTLLELADPPGD